MAEGRRSTRSERARDRDDRPATRLASRLVPVLIGLAILALGVSIALGSRTANAAEAGPTPVTVHIRDDGLNPAAANAEPGGTVIWINDTNAVRSVVATDASFMSGPLEPGEQFQFAFTEPRYVNYEVPEQPGVAGTVVVGDAAATSDPPVPVPTGPPAAAPEPVPTSGFAYTGASSAVNALIGGLVLAFGAGLIALGHHFGWTAALTSWTFANMTDDMLPSRRHRRVRKAQARRSFRPWERRRT